jgi:hypothetical protein
MAKRRIASVTTYYDSDDVRDAPEHHEHARAMGTLTWGTWDHSVRPFEQRRQDFVAAFPPADPVRFSPGGGLIRQQDGTFAPGSPASRLQRFLADDWVPGSIHELLSRYGLRLSNGPAHRERSFVAGSFRDTARKRNHRLRVLHGGVDIEAADMDAAKAEFLDVQEKKRAAEEVRQALKQMRSELDDDSGN